ncbi:MAG: ABC-2 transporter permease [Allobaculum sp.]|nr:ABC-2 transporter permease [Allobaculum sp.]
MRGLFIHDLMIFKKQTLLWVILIALTILYTVLDMPNFMVGFGTIYLAMFAIKTIILELEKHTGPFFFTLPFSNAQFIAEKYLLVISLPLFFGLILSLLNVALGKMSLEDSVWSSGMALVGVLLLSIIMIPLVIRFQDKAVFISMALTAGLFLGIGLVQDQFSFQDLAFLKEYLLWIEIGLPLILVLLLILSVFLSLKWLKAKQF